MKVFISWSGEPSRTVAAALWGWLPDVLQLVEPWMSAADIQAGARWSKEIAQELAETRFGILCLTRDNQRSPWVLFEAGALARTLPDTFVCPYLIGMRPSDLEAGPLVQFQTKQADREGTWELVRSLNRALKESALAEDRLRRLFDRSWPDLERTLAAVPEGQAPAETARPVEDMVGEILQLVRSVARRDANESAERDAVADVIRSGPDLDTRELRRLYLNQYYARPVLGDGLRGLERLVREAGLEPEQDRADPGGPPKP